MARVVDRLGFGYALAALLLLATGAHGQSGPGSEHEARFDWSAGILQSEGNAPADALTRIRFETIDASDGVTDIHILLETTPATRRDGSRYVWNRDDFYYSFVENGVAFLAVPEEADIVYERARVEMYDKAEKDWIGLNPSRLDDRDDLGPFQDLLLLLLDAASGLPFGPAVTIGQAALEVSAFADELAGRIDMREVVPPQDGGFSDPNDYDTLALRFHQPRIAEEFPTRPGAGSDWYSASDFFDLRRDPRQAIRFIVPFENLSSGALDRLDAWVLFAEHYAVWPRGQPNATLVDIGAHTVRFAGPSTARGRGDGGDPVRAATSRSALRPGILFARGGYRRERR